jgi:thioredoxin 1
MELTVTEKNFQREVIESSQPVIVNFSAPWCGLCHLIAPILLTVHSQHDREFKLVKVNADDNLKLANTYRLKTLPTLLLFNKGQVTHRLDSFRGRDDFRKSLELMFASLSTVSNT